MKLEKAEKLLYILHTLKHMHILRHLQSSLKYSSILLYTR